MVFIETGPRDVTVGHVTAVRKGLGGVCCGGDELRDRWTTPSGAPLEKNENVAFVVIFHLSASRAPHSGSLLVCCFFVVVVFSAHPPVRSQLRKVYDYGPVGGTHPSLRAGVTADLTSARCPLTTPRPLPSRDARWENNLSGRKSTYRGLRRGRRF